MGDNDATELAGQVRQIIAEEIDMDADEIDDSANFADEYDADSMSLIQVFSRIERELKVPVPQQEMENMTSLRAVTDIVRKYAGAEV